MAKHTKPTQEELEANTEKALQEAEQIKETEVKWLCNYIVGCYSLNDQEKAYDYVTDFVKDKVIEEYKKTYLKSMEELIERVKKLDPGPSEGSAFKNGKYSGFRNCQDEVLSLIEDAFIVKD